MDIFTKGRGFYKILEFNIRGAVAMDLFCNSELCGQYDFIFAFNEIDNDFL